jgi:thiol-disulfide isomerase/thioredoxin
LSLPGRHEAPTLDTPGAALSAACLLRGDFGDFEVIEEVGRGGMGVIFRARQKSLGRVVALKLILAGQLASPEQVRRFHHEAEEAGQLDHPHIVPIYQVGELNGQHFFAMKLIEGGSLGDRIKHFTRDHHGAARLMATVARAVHYAHQRGVLHRDLKPGNILLDECGQPHVTDFGLAKHLGHEGTTLSGAILGTPGYMAPEQAAGRKDVSVAADVHGLGAVLYELLTGQAPFRAESHVDVLLQVLEHDAAAPRSVNRQVHPDLETVCLKCLRKDPVKRYASALELAEDLERWLAGEPILARRAGRLERAAKWARRRPAAAALLAVTALAALVLLVGGWWYNGRLQRALAASEASEREAQDERAKAVVNAKEAQKQRERAEISAREAGKARLRAETSASMARKERAKAEASATEAKEQRARAEASFRRTFETIDDLLLNLDGRLAQQQGAESMRHEFLREFLNIAERSRAEKPADPFARRQCGRVWARLAEVAWRSGNFPQSDQAFREARTLQRALANEFPDKPEYQTDLAQTYGEQSRSLQQRGELSTARSALAQAFKIRDALARKHSDFAEYRLQAERDRFQLANLLEEAGQARQARDAYTQALAQVQKLAAAQPTAQLHYFRAVIADSLGALLARKEPAEAVKHFEYSLQARRQACQFAMQAPGYLQELRSYYTVLATELKKQGLHRRLADLADKVAEEAADPKLDTYNAACYMALASVATGKSAGDGEAKKKLADGYAERAVKLLAKALQAGYPSKRRDRDHMDQDSDLDPLRQRPDFKKLLAQVDARMPPQTPAEEVRGLMNDYANEEAAIDRRQKQAGTVAQKARAAAQVPPLVAYSERFLQLAQKHRDNPAALEALGWIIQQTIHNSTEPEQVAARKHRARALEALRRDHAARPDIEQVCLMLVTEGDPDCDKVLAAVHEKHPQERLRGLAALALAASRSKQAEQLRASDSARAAVLAKEADGLYTLVAEKYPAHQVSGNTLGEIAKKGLVELRHLSVGSVAQEIDGKDLYGKPMKLSDFKGKVVVLDFWANWCGYCRMEYEANKVLVQRLADKPFVLLGINADDDAAVVRGVVKRQGLNWRSWYDGGGEGGRIMKQWQVESYPTVFVLDHKGVIRYKGLRGKQLAAAVDRLMREQRDATKR